MYQDRNSGPSQKVQGNWQCSDCGTAITELPFQPEGDRPIRCRDCHRKWVQDRPKRPRF
jgi:CxxC-x17-CxxC domain-containing protein